VRYITGEKLQEFALKRAKTLRAAYLDPIVSRGTRDIQVCSGLGQNEDTELFTGIRDVGLREHGRETITVACVAHGEMVHTGEIPIIKRVVSSVDGKTQVRLHASLPGFGTIGAAATTKKRALLGAKKKERTNE